MKDRQILKEEEDRQGEREENIFVQLVISSVRKVKPVKRMDKPQLFHI